MKAALILPLLLVACATAPSPLAPPDAEVRPVIANDRLDGRWSIVAVNGQPLHGPYIDLAGGSARYQLACNGGSARASRNGDKFFLSGMSLTEMGCEAPRMQADERLFAVLRLPMTMELTPPDRLRLVNEGGTIDLVRRKG